MKNKIYYFAIAGLVILFFYFSYQIYIESRPLQVIFLDVGQGDSILIQKGTKQILIDGGPSGKTELAELGKYLPYFDREIEIVIATHPDRDHIAGLVDAARNYKIDEVLDTAAEKDTAAFKEWQDVLKYNKVPVQEVWRGLQISFDGAEMKVLDPPGKVAAGVGDSNNSSIVARLDDGSSSFLFTGDMETNEEKELLASNENINVDYLKVAHHGSKYSSTDEFLNAVSPETGIISVGKNNSYGHPAPETLDKLKARNINIFRTDENGDIVFECKKYQPEADPPLAEKCYKL